MPSTVDPGHPDALAQAIAALDAVQERQGAAGDAARLAYEARRAELKARLVAALADASHHAEVDTAAGSR